MWKQQGSVGSVSIRVFTEETLISEYLNVLRSLSPNADMHLKKIER